MTRTEQAVLKGIKVSLQESSNAKSGDDWEMFGNRCQTTMKTNISIINELLQLEPEGDEPEELKLS